MKAMILSLSWGKWGKKKNTIENVTFFCKCYFLLLKNKYMLSILKKLNSCGDLKILIISTWFMRNYKKNIKLGKEKIEKLYIYHFWLVNKFFYLSSLEIKSKFVFPLFLFNFFFFCSETLYLLFFPLYFGLIFCFLDLLYIYIYWVDIMLRK